MPAWRDCTQTRSPATLARAAGRSRSLLASASRVTSAARAEPAAPIVSVQSGSRASRGRLPSRPGAAADQALRNALTLHRAETCLGEIMAKRMIHLA